MVLQYDKMTVKYYYSNMNPNFAFFLLLSTLFVAAVPQNCSPSLLNDQLQTGSYTFLLSSAPQRVQCYNNSLPSNAVTSLQLSYGLSNIFNFEGGNSGVDFSLRGRIDAINQILSFTLIINNGTYGTLTVSYLLISNRRDILAGSFIADTNLLLECNAQQTALIPIPIANPPQPTNDTLGILVFVNGIRTQSWIFNLNFQQPLIDYTRNQINVTVITDAAYPIETIFFSYLIINLNQLGLFYSYSFTVSPVQSDFTVAGIVGLSNASSMVQYAFFHLNKINNLTCLGFNCSKCLSASSCASLGGAVYGSQCLKCGQNQFFAGTGCVCSNGYYLISGSCGTCPAGTIYSSGIQACISCGNNANLVNGKCTCNNGYYNISGLCQSCPGGTAFNALLLSCSSVCSGGLQWINSACSCPVGTLLISNSCGTCQQGYSYSALTLSCNKICAGANQLYSNGQCVCTSGYTLSNNFCVLISASTIGSSNSASNTPTCGANQYVLNGACKCYSNYVQYQGSCYSCPSNSSVTLDQTGCICNQGYSLTSGYTCAPYSSTVTASTSTNSPSSSTGLSSASSTLGTPSSSTNANLGSTSPAPSSSNSGLGIPTSLSSSSQQCASGSYFNGNTCQSCSSYCSSCLTSNICISCLTGYQLSQTTTNNIFSSFCTAINTPNCHIALLKNVKFGNAIYQNILVSPLPANLTANGCPNCPFLLNATLLSAPLGSLLQLNFIPSTQYQYVLTAIIPNSTNIASGIVVLDVSLNKTYSSYFSAADMAQHQTLTINLSTIAVLNATISSVTNAVSSLVTVLSNDGQSTVPDNTDSSQIVEISKILNK